MKVSLRTILLFSILSTFSAGGHSVCKIETNPSGFVSDLAKARSICAKGGEVILRLEPGKYYLSETIKLGAEDSRLTIESVIPGKARIVRGENVTPGGIVDCVPEKMPDGEGFTKVKPHLPYFFYDSKWAVEARWPNNGYFTFSKVIDAGIRGRALNSIQPDNPTQPGSFVFDSNRPAKWNYEDGVWLCGYFTHDWSYERLRAKSFTSSNNVMQLAYPATFGVGGKTWSALKDRRFFVTGVRAELDAPGEYYFDRKTRRVDFIAPEGMKEFIAVTKSGAVFELKGAKKISFKGLVFEYALDGFVLKDSSDITIEGCIFRNICAYPIKVSGGRKCKISNCSFTGIGLTCACISGGNRRTLENAEHEISGCSFTDFAKVNKTYDSAIKLSGCGNRVINNKISDAPHTALFYNGNEHLISGNEVWDVMKETGDCGAFYTGRDPTSRGNVLSFNYIHDCGVRKRKTANVMAFYLDDCDAGDTVISNRVVNVPRGLLIGGGQDNKAIGNVFENCDIGLSIDDRGVYELEKWDSPIDKSWQITRKALEMPIFEEPWASRYPNMVTFLKESPREPLHVVIKDNHFISCDLPIEYYLKGPNSKKALSVSGNKFEDKK